MHYLVLNYSIKNALSFLLQLFIIKLLITFSGAELCLRLNSTFLNNL